MDWIGPRRIVDRSQFDPVGPTQTNPMTSPAQVESSFVEVIVRFKRFLARAALLSALLDH